jgi:hypothetical protein
MTRKNQNKACTMRIALPTTPASPLPPLFAAWVHDLLPGPIPHETEATCDHCAMSPPPGVRTKDHDEFFHPETKCCTYVPALPNFLVGRILADPDPAFAHGRATVEERLRSGVGVTPLGIAQPPAFSLIYRQVGKTVFGKSRSLRCPHYLEDGGRCGVWKHRAAICSTWYCKHVRGAVGEHFWFALHRLLAAVENTLARWCVLELDPGVPALERLFPRPPQPGELTPVNPQALDGQVDPETDRSLWGCWAGRETAFYQECAQLVEPLSWEQITAIGGPDISLYSRLVQDAYAQLVSRQVPPALRVGTLNVQKLSPESAYVSGYSETNRLELPRALLDVLPSFDGRPTRKVLTAIEDERNIKLDRGLVRKLVDFEILVPCPPSAG